MPCTKSQVGFWREKLNPWTGAPLTLTDSLLITGNGVISSFSALDASQVGFWSSALHSASIEHDSTNQRLQNRVSKGNWGLLQNWKFLNTRVLFVGAEKLS